MTPILSRFKAVGAAAVLALSIGAAGFATAPAFAQDEPPMGFSLNVPEPQPVEPPPVTPPGLDSYSERSMVGGEGDFQTFGSEEAQTYREGHYDPGTDDFYYCLDDREIVRGLRDYGFRRVNIVRYLRGERVEVVAEWGRRQYSMRVDRCTGVVDRVRLIRRSGFGFQFDFSN